MNKTLIIIQREFMTRVGKKSFILLTVLMPFIFAALIFVPVWLAGIKDGEQKTVVVVDKTGRYAGLFRDDASYRFVPAAAVTPYPHFCETRHTITINFSDSEQK